MSLTKFKIERTGQFFYYDNSKNGLLDNKFKPLYRPFEPYPEFEELKDRFGTDTKSKSPEAIKITLGHGCNYSCGYCLQKDIGNPDERPANGLTPTLLKNIQRHLDLHRLERIELWGGETLLYWKDMLPIIDALDHEGITWYIPTNGTTLLPKHLDKFMTLKGNVTIGISHDGPGHEELRGKEFIHKKVEVFRRIQDECFPKVQFSFNPVISRNNYDLFAINDFFADFIAKNNLKPIAIQFELGRVYDEDMAENSTHHVIAGEDIEKYRVILHRFLDAHLQHFTGGNFAKTEEEFRDAGHAMNATLLANSLFHTGLGVIPYAKTLRDESVPLLTTNCGADDSRLISMDLLGNIRTCQNVDDSYNSGNLMMIGGVKVHNVNFDRSDFCGTCPVYRLCKSSCPLDLGTAVFHTNHNIETIHYGEIQKAAFKLLFKSEIEEIERNIQHP